MSNFVFGVDVVLLAKKMVSKNRTKYRNVEDIVTDAIGDASVSFDPSRGVKFDNFCWKIFNNKVKDRLDYDNVRKNNVSINANEDIDMIDKGEDLVSQVASNAKELFELGYISELEHNIIVLKSHRYENQEIAEKLGLSNGRISQIWAEIQEALAE